MQIDVTLYPPLTVGRFTRQAVAITDPATVAGLLAKVGIPQEQVASVYLNGQSCTFAQPLADGDRLTVLPYIGGG